MRKNRRSNQHSRKRENKAVLSGFWILQMNERGAEKFGQILSTLEKNGPKISDIDTMTAAIATSKGRKRDIYNEQKDFEKIPQLIGNILRNQV